VLYLTVSLHQKNRATQAALLRQQRALLVNVIEPLPPAPEPRPKEIAVGLVEMAKDRWNRELETVVRRVYETDWRRVRERAEDRVGAVVEKIREAK
jgi:altered-inheritance-of-mitochondria protein 5